MVRNISNKQDTEDVIIICHHRQNHIAELLKKEINKHLLSSKALVVSDENSQTTKLVLFDECKLLIPLLSEEYLNTSYLMEQFNTALCRHRADSHIILCPVIVGQLPKSPVYPRVSFCFFSSLDAIWSKPKDVDPLMNCIQTAAVVFANIITQSPICETSYKTILSVRELEDWVLCKKHFGEPDEILSPLLFGSSHSGHTVLDTTKNDRNDDAENLAAITKDDKPSKVLSSDLLAIKGSHAIQILPDKQNEREQKIDEIEIQEKAAPKLSTSASIVSLTCTIS